MLKRIFRRLTGVNSSPIRLINDEYVQWLTFANAGMLNNGNLYCFDYAIKNLPANAPIIEIGSFCGLSTNIMNHLLRKHKKSSKIFTSDKWIFEGAEQGGLVGESEIPHSEYRGYVMNSFKNNVQFFSSFNLPYSIEVFSDEFFKLWEEEATVKDLFGREITLGGEIGFAYIDGNHTYEYAKRDFENASKFLAGKGFILFDDSSRYSKFGCAALMAEIVEDPNYELVIENPNFMFRKIL